MKWMIHQKEEVKKLAKDVVCGMKVEEKEAEAKGLVSEYKGQKYYFCAPGCKHHFEKDPEKFLSKDPTKIFVTKDELEH